VKAALKPLCIVAILLCKLAQGAVLPLPAQVSACPHHSMQHLSAGEGTLLHAPCCKYAGCDCMQAPALLAPAPMDLGFVGAADSTEALPADLLLTPAATFFRPPIPQVP
jgi:hypothetical protein